MPCRVSVYRTSFFVFFLRSPSLPSPCFFPFFFLITTHCLGFTIGIRPSLNALSATSPFEHRSAHSIVTQVFRDTVLTRQARCRVEALGYLLDRNVGSASTRSEVLGTVGVYNTSALELSQYLPPSVVVSKLVESQWIFSSLARHSVYIRFERGRRR